MVYCCAARSDHAPARNGRRGFGFLDLGLASGTPISPSVQCLFFRRVLQARRFKTETDVADIISVPRVVPVFPLAMNMSRAQVSASGSICRTATISLWRVSCIPPLDHRHQLAIQRAHGQVGLPSTTGSMRQCACTADAAEVVSSGFSGPCFVCVRCRSS